MYVEKNSTYHRRTTIGTSRRHVAEVTSLLTSAFLVHTTHFGTSHIKEAPADLVTM